MTATIAVPHAKYCHECRAAFDTFDPTDELCAACQRQWLRENCPEAFAEWEPVSPDGTRWYEQADCPDLDADEPDYLATIRAQTDAALARARGLRWPDRDAALDYLAQPDVELNQQAIDDYFAHMERTDPFMQPEE
jgi:hypothetical protein